MSTVKPKKALGQHFLREETTARAIVDALTLRDCVLEVGPGTGVLTKYLLQSEISKLKVVEIDHESVEYLLGHYPSIAGGLLEADFLKMDLRRLFGGDFAIIGNFPYNISSQIFFKILEVRDRVPEVVCMIQKEVAERIASAPGCRQYGILSVFLQAWYDIEYLFTVPPGAFYPPPKVDSAVIRLRRNARTTLGCDEKLFARAVKGTFQQRRKTIRNSLRSAALPVPGALSAGGDPGCVSPAGGDYAAMRPEQLSVEDFISLTQQVAQLM